MSQLLTLRQAARFLGVSQTTLRRMIDRGQLPGELQPGPFGERWMVPQAALEAFPRAGGAPGGGGAPGPGAGGAAGAPTVETGGAGGDPRVGTSAAGGAPAAGAGRVAQASPVGMDGAAGAPPPGVVGGGGDPGAAVPLETLEKALELAHRHMDRAQELEADLALERERAAEAQERAARAERQALELRYVLTQHQRALAEAAESLAEERARAQAAELATAAPQPPGEGVSSRSETPLARPGWGTRFRRWLLREKTA